VLRPRVNDCSDKRLDLTQINANDLVRVSLLRFVLDSEVKDNLAFVVQADGWAANLAFAKT
jgi:hypothetical protein